MRVLGAVGRGAVDQAARLAPAAGAAENGRRRPGTGADHPRDLVELVTGAEQVRYWFGQARHAASREVCGLITAAPAEGGRRAKARRPGSAAQIRLVVDQGVLERPGALEELRGAMGHGANVRVAERVPTGMLVADRSLAVVPLVRDGVEPGALVVRAEGLLESLLGMFESLWSRALPPAGTESAPAPHAGRPPDDVDLKILSLLLNGCTDTAVAKQLDLGLRTVQRRVKRLMELARVTTRLQLGWHANERGWVPRG